MSINSVVSHDKFKFMKTLYKNLYENYLKEIVSPFLKKLGNSSQYYSIAFGICSNKEEFAIVFKKELDKINEINDLDFLFKNLKPSFEKKFLTLFYSKVSCLYEKTGIKPNYNRSITSEGWDLLQHNDYLNFFNKHLENHEELNKNRFETISKEENNSMNELVKDLLKREVIKSAVKSTVDKLANTYVNKHSSTTQKFFETIKLYPSKNDTLIDDNNNNLNLIKKKDKSNQTTKIKKNTANSNDEKERIIILREKERNEFEKLKNRTIVKDISEIDNNVYFEKTNKKYINEKAYELSMLNQKEMVKNNKILGLYSVSGVVNDNKGFYSTTKGNIENESFYFNDDKKLKIREDYLSLLGKQNNYDKLHSINDFDYKQDSCRLNKRDVYNLRNSSNIFFS